MKAQERDRWRALRSAVIVAASLFARAATGQEESYPTFRFAGFADAQLTHSTRTNVNDLDFSEFDPYAKAQFSDAWSALVEALVQSVERGGDAEHSSRSRVKVDLERAFASYSRSDVFRLQVGEINNGIIDWNEREQLPRFLQTSIDVPSIARREEQGGAWPLHFIGAWASGEVFGASGVRYGVGLGEGRGRTRDDIAIFSGSRGPAGLVSISFAPDSLSGLEIGAAALLDEIPAPEGHYREIDQTLSANYLNGPIEFRGEWSRMDHRLLSSNHDYVTQGWYVLISTRLSGAFRQYRPYMLLDHLDVANGEPYLADVSDQRAWAAGIRWDAARHVAIKLDFRSQHARSPEFERILRLQAAIAF